MTGFAGSLLSTIDYRPAGAGALQVCRVRDISPSPLTDKRDDVPCANTHVHILYLLLRPVGAASGGGGGLRVDVEGFASL